MISESALNLGPDSGHVPNFTSATSATSAVLSGVEEPSSDVGELHGGISVQTDPESVAELEALLPRYFYTSSKEKESPTQILAKFCHSCEYFLRQVLLELPQELLASDLQKQNWVKQFDPEFFQSLLQSYFWRDWQLNLLLCSDRRMTVWNLEFRGIDGPTDILSFPLAASTFLKERDELAEKILEGNERGGDLLLSLSSWLRNCRNFACDAETELQRLLLHGVLHLAGLDHGDEYLGEAEEFKELGNFEKLGPMLQLQEYLLRHSLERRSILKR